MDNKFQNFATSNNKNSRDNNSNGKNFNLNKIKNRLLMLSPTINAGLEKECSTLDFYRHGNKAVGKGGFGEVWKVTHKVTNKTYAIKVMDKRNIIEQNMVDQINREIEIMYKINHPHVIKLINHFEDEENFYLIMNYASKGQLYTYLKKHNRFDQRLSAQYMRELAEAIKYLHSFSPPIIHRDIKPENLLLDDDGRLKLADFGWSNFKGSKQRDTFCGTPDYLSPEMVNKQGHDTSVDIWSFGVLLFEFLSGHAPFSGLNQEELFMNIRRLKINWPNDFPPLAKNLITKILKLNPQERITIDEILSHSWFEKNPPIKSIVINLITDPKLILESHLINVSPEKVSDKLNDIVNDIKIKVSIISKSKNTYQTSPSSISSEEYKELASEKKSEIEKLTREISELKKKCEIYEIEIVKYKEMLADTKKFGEMQKMSEELEKYRIVNKDRLDLLSELEEKNNEIFELKNKIKEYESENKSLSQNFEKLQKKNVQNENLLENSDLKIKEMRNKINELVKEKEDTIMNYQKKLDILQFKVLESNSDHDESSITRVLEVLNESINDMKTIFASKVSNTYSCLCDIKEENQKIANDLSEKLAERTGQINELFLRFKCSLEDDLINANLKVKKESNAAKNNQIVDWLKKQINELQNYKNKSIFLENKMSHLETSVSQLNVKLNSSESKVDNLEKIILLKNEKICELKTYTEKIEAKLSDVKDFVFKNCSDLLDSFNNTFNSY